MEKITIFDDGTEVPRGWCILPDHYQTTFALVLVGPKVMERLQSKFEVTAMIKHEVTIRTMTPDIIDQALALISQKDAQAIKQVTVVKKHQKYGS